MNINAKILIPSLMTLALTACGGGGGGDNGETPTDPKTFMVYTNVASGQGEISPDNREVQKGKTTDFTITPAQGFEIDTVSGCNGTLAGSTYTTGAINGKCTVSAEFNKLPQEPSAISVESFESDSDVSTNVDSEGNLVVTVEGNTSGSITFDSQYTDYEMELKPTEFAVFSQNNNVLEYITYTVESVQETDSFLVTAKNGESDVAVNVVFKVTDPDVEIADGFCFEGYCDGEDPKEVKHNLFEDRKYTAHYIAIAPAETSLKYNVSPDFGKVEKIEVTEDVSGDAFSYDYKINENEIVIHNPYSYNSEPLVNYTVRMTSETGELAEETVSIMYFNAYESGRFTNFNDTPVALPMSGSKTFKVELQNYGAADSKEILIRDFNMLIPSIVGSVDENDTCEVVNGSVTLESCDLISMSVDNENNEVTITTNLSNLINNNRESFNSGLNLYPYIAVCVSTLQDKLNPEDCEEMYMAGMNGFISEYSAAEQTKIDELEQIMPKVRAFFEYDVAIKELTNILNAKGYITNEEREDYIDEIRFLSAPIVQEYNLAMQYIFNINGNSISSLEEHENTIQITIENIQYYLDSDFYETEKSNLYNRIINDAGVFDSYGYLDSSSPIILGNDDQPTRFAYNESYGQIVDGKFVFDSKYRILNLAVKKSKK